MTRRSCRPPRRTPDRGVSTVLDVALFLLLLSAAVGLLYAAPRPGQPATDPDIAAEAATTLATTTTAVEYTPAVDRGDLPALDGADATERTARGTVAEHLAAATVANAAIGDRTLRHAPGHESAVRNATRRTLARIEAGVDLQVRSFWEPLPGSGVRGELVVGPSPPPDANVHAATSAVPVGAARETGITTPAWTAAAGGWSNDTSGADRRGANASDGSLVGAAVAAPAGLSLEQVARRRGCDGLSTAIARRTVGAAFPPARTEAALRAGGALEARTVARYRRVAAAAELESVDVPVETDPARSPARATNAVLVRALAGAFEPTACSNDSVTAAAREAAPATVTIVVRTWSR